MKKGNIMVCIKDYTTLDNKVVSMHLTLGKHYQLLNGMIVNDIGGKFYEGYGHSIYFKELTKYREDRINELLNK